MNSNDFENVVERQIDSCKNILLNKAKEYAMDNDRLHNFKNAAGMMGCDPKEALAGMMAKHTISIYDMCRDNEPHSMELWDEKITDHINYLLLLKAIVEEQNPPYIPIEEETQSVKPNEGLDAKIKEFSERIRTCAEAECDNCPYNYEHLGGNPHCSKAFTRDFDDLIIQVKEAK